MPIAKGATVRQIQPAPIKGTVTERRLNDSYGEVEYGVTTADGTLIYLRESQCEEVPAATPGEGA